MSEPTHALKRAVVFSALIVISNRTIILELPTKEVTSWIKADPKHIFHRFFRGEWLDRLLQLTTPEE
jgi:hypothetical protein